MRIFLAVLLIVISTAAAAPLQFEAHRLAQVDFAGSARGSSKAAFSLPVTLARIQSDESSLSGTVAVIQAEEVKGAKDIDHVRALSPIPVFLTQFSGWLKRAYLFFCSIAHLLCQLVSGRGASAVLVLIPAANQTCSVRFFSVSSLICY